MDGPQELGRHKICEAHAKMTETCRYYRLNRDEYVPPGETRTTTKKTITDWRRDIQYCPYMKVDEEIDFICDEAKVQSWSSSMSALSSYGTNRSACGLCHRTRLRPPVGCTCCYHSVVRLM